MTSPSLDSAVTLLKFRVFVGFNECIGDLDQQRFQVSTRAGNSGGFNLSATAVVARTTACPGAEMFRRRKHGHIDTNFRNECNGGHRIGREARNGTNQLQRVGVWLGKTVDLGFNQFTMMFDLVNVVETFTKLNRLFS